MQIDRTLATLAAPGSCVVSTSVAASRDPHADHAASCSTSTGTSPISNTTVVMSPFAVLDLPRVTGCLNRPGTAGDTIP
jgi:hypothetical protein